MLPKHNYIKNPEFDGLETFVWDGLNQIGKTIPRINDKLLENENIDSSKRKEGCQPIWHNKSDLDEFVADSLNLNMDDYGRDLSKNSLYKAIANEVRVLRRRKILIDWDPKKAKNFRPGVWRLDKTRLTSFVQTHVKEEMKNKNYHSDGLPYTVYVRQKQNIFRKELLMEYKKCVFCGFKLCEYMTAAHIVPYSVMRKEEPTNSMNPTNGLLLCKLCDVAFEYGSIKVQSDLHIEISDSLKEENVPVVKSWIDSVSSDITIKKNARYPPDPKYLKWKKRLVENKVTTFS